MDRVESLILFVDSDENQLASLKRSLREQSSRWEMHFAQSGYEALKLMEIYPVDIVVSETQLVGMSGAELFKQLQSQYPQAARLLLSGEVFRTPSREVLSYAHQFITKPCPAKDLITLLEAVSQLHGQLRDPAIGALLGGVKSLPSLPFTYQRLVKTLRSEQASIAEIGAIVSEDISMATKVLQLVNSAFFGLPQKISSPEHAVIMLGLETVTNLALSIGIFSQIDPALNEEFELDILWNHSVRTAELVRALAIDMKLPRPAIELQVLAGLLHDLGKLLLATLDTHEYRLILRYAAETGLPLEQVESEALWCNHARVGAYLMALWGLPYQAVEAVAYHHDTEKQSAARPDHLLVFAANLLDASLHQEADQAEVTLVPLELLMPTAQFNRWKALAKEMFHGQADRKGPHGR